MILIFIDPTRSSPQRSNRIINKWPLTIIRVCSPGKCITTGSQSTYIKIKRMRDKKGMKWTKLSEA